MVLQRPEIYGQHGLQLPPTLSPRAHVRTRKFQWIKFLTVRIRIFQRVNFLMHIPKGKFSHKRQVCSDSYESQVHFCLNLTALRRPNLYTILAFLSEKKGEGEWVHFQRKQLCHFNFHSFPLQEDPFCKSFTFKESEK